MAEQNSRCSSCFAVKAEQGVCPNCGCDETARNAPHQLPVGTVLKEQYKIGRVLGQGGFGITYLGWDLYLDIPVAIKEYYPSGMVMRECTVTHSVTDVSGDDGIRFHNNRERFLREAKMLARFSQVPEIVQIKNFFLANNTAYIVMEYVEGITLKQHVKNQGGKLSVQETLSLLGPVIQTLAKVHRTGIVHRDISPDNIMLVPGGAKLLDFGAVRSVSGEAGKELTKSTEAILKQGYAPIEQYQKKGSLGPWTDVYALCATIYYCLTGEVPPDAPARVLAYEEMDMDATGLDAHQCSALLHGMALRAEERTGSMEELYRELFSPNTEETVVRENIEAATRSKVLAAPPVPEEAPAVPSGVHPEPAAEQRTAPEKTAPDKKKPNPGKKGKGILIAAFAAVAVIAAIAAAVLLGGAGEREVPEAPATEETVGIVHSSAIPGSNVNWTLHSDGTLQVTGSGEIPQDCGVFREYSDRIRHICIEGEIQRIGAGVFEGLPKLESLTVTGILREVCADAFADSGLQEIELGTYVEQIGDGAFRGTQLQNVVLPESVTFVGNQAFAECDQLKSAVVGPYTRLCYDEINNAIALPIFCGEGGVISEDFTLKGYSAGIVEDYAKLHGMRFEAIGKAEPEGRGVVDTMSNVTWWFDRETGFLKIDGEGWMGCYGGSFRYYGDLSYANGNEIPWKEFREEVRTLSIGDAILSGIPANTFENHSNLDDVYIGKQITGIGQYAFANTAIDWLHLPDNVESIEPYAFDSCKKLRHVVIPMSMWGVEEFSFNNCTNIEDFYTPGWLRYSFNKADTPFTSAVKGTLEMPPNMVIYSYGEGEWSAEDFADTFGIPMKQGVDGRRPVLMGRAGGRVFWSLEDGTLTIFGYGDTGFYQSNASEQYAWNDGIAQSFYKNQEAEYYIYRDEIEHIIIEPGVTRLNRGNFVDMPNLKSIDFGTVEGIYSEAFVNCGIKTLDFPETVHSIQRNAVKNCTQLTQVSIRNGTQMLGDNMFAGCTSLQRIFLYSDAKPGKNFLQGTENVAILARENSPAAQFAYENGIPFSSLIISE